MTMLQVRIAELIKQHGSLRAAARVLECDAGYLSRLRSGEKDTPEDWLLRRMKLRRVVTYERTDGVPCVLCTSPDYCSTHGCRQRPSDDEPQRNADFEAGWRTAANWMNRDDLIADIGSPAYLADLAKALASGVKTVDGGQQ